MNRHRVLSSLLLGSLVLVLAAGCIVPGQQSPAENTADKDRDGVRDDQNGDHGSDTTVPVNDTNETNMTPTIPSP